MECLAGSRKTVLRFCPPSVTAISIVATGLRGSLHFASTLYHSRFALSSTEYLAKSWRYIFKQRHRLCLVRGAKLISVARFRVETSDRHLFHACQPSGRFIGQLRTGLHLHFRPQIPVRAIAKRIISGASSFRTLSSDD